MTYTKLHKSSSWNPEIQKKNAFLAALPMAIQTKSVSGSPQEEQEMPSYTPLPADGIANHPLMRSLSENTPAQASSQVETKSLIQRREESLLDEPIPSDFQEQALVPESIAPSKEEIMTGKFLDKQKAEREAELASMGGGYKEDEENKNPKDTAKRVINLALLNSKSEIFQDEENQKYLSILKAKPQAEIEDKQQHGRALGEEWVGEEEAGNEKYFHDEEKASHEVKINEQGLLTTTNEAGEQVPLNTQAAEEREIAFPGSKEKRYIFAREHGTKKMYAADEGKEYRKPDAGRVPHAGLVEGQNVQGAGEVETAHDGRITAISDRSGHYKPEAEDTYEFVKDLATSKEEGGLGAKLIDDSKDEAGHAKNTPARVELGGKGEDLLLTDALGLGEYENKYAQDEISLTYQQFLQTGGNEAQIRNKQFLTRQIGMLKNENESTVKPSEIDSQSIREAAAQKVAQEQRKRLGIKLRGDDY
ncbi:hypothetical protein [Coleofasciculus sp. FACHB-1120]|uniref:hypothetical protein n=1 Tax=Coleofasciculus sp. FACHB-1120 TaxID=2692783 RepID=UPI001682590E|nr:hypothetical protein [Coleofasciculus sp. FACHB-1120]MBD2742455.1 hypothetical protein [Coleofasciculus sp. FACHB-1120]